MKALAMASTSSTVFGTLQAKLIQPVLADKDHDRGIRLGLDIGNAHDLAVQGRRGQGGAFGLGVVFQDVLIGVLLDVGGQIFDGVGSGQLLNWSGSTIMTSGYRRW